MRNLDCSNVVIDMIYGTNCDVDLHDFTFLFSLLFSSILSMNSLIFFFFAIDNSFQSCGVTWKYCERDFAKCMKNVCKESSKEGCEEQANMFSSMTKMFGSGFFDMSQDGVCECVNKEDAAARYVSFLQEISTLSVEDAENLVAKYEKKSGIMVYKALKKYKDRTVIFQDIKDEL